MTPTKTGLYSTNVGDRFILLYWDGEDWVNQDGIRPCYKEVHWTGKPLFVPALRTWVELTDEDLDYLCHLAYTGDEEFALTVQAKLKEKNHD
jgi:hypothetical protein